MRSIEEAKKTNNDLARAAQEQGAVDMLPDNNKHQLEYSIWSCKVSWCDVCKKHYYNEANKKHTIKATPEHFHITE